MIVMVEKAVAGFTFDGGKLKAEGVEPQEICPRICERVPYTPQYVRELLSDRYKRPYEMETSFHLEPKKRLFDVWSIAEPPKAPLF
jgi:hypothetical protein